MTSNTEKNLIVDTSTLSLLAHTEGTIGLDTLVATDQKLVVLEEVISEIEKWPDQRQKYGFRPA